METWSERVTRQMRAKQRVCTVCGKVCYDSEVEAGRVIREYHSLLRRMPYYLRGESPALVPKRAYFDERCGVWHVTKHRAPRPVAETGTSGGYRVTDRQVMRLPAPPAVNPRTRAADYLEALALSLRDEIRQQGGGLRLPPRKALEQHYAGVPWSLISQARDLLVDTGWLHRMSDGGTGWWLVTVGRSFTETSRVSAASLTA